jgi:hypothetical protein
MTPTARVLGIPHIEGSEVVFAVWVQGLSTAAEVVRVTTVDPETFDIDKSGMSAEVSDLAREEVARWVDIQRRFMDRLYAKLASDRKQRELPSHVRPRAASIAPPCALCRGTGESEKFLDRSGGQARWAFGPKITDAPFRDRGVFVPCPACRRIDYDRSVETSVPSHTLSGELERVEAIVTGRIATIREKMRSMAPPARVGGLPRRRR